MKRFAVVLLFLRFSVPPAFAQVAIAPGVPTPVAVDAVMNNSFSITVTDLDFGAVALTSRTGETGELVMDTDGTFDVSGNTDPIARIAPRDPAGQQGTVAVAAGLPDTLLSVRYVNVQNLVCVAGCAGANPEIVVARIGDDMPDQAGAWSVDDADPDGDAVPGQGMTDAGGAITFNIGATLRTADTNDPYQSGTYEGSFDVILEY